MPDICDQLQGRYPKGFKFVGWHPHCRCIVTSILDLSSEPQQIKGTPQQFNEWVQDNAKRIKTADKRGTTPYFVRDNRDAVENALKKKKKTPQQIAAERHAARTPEQVNAIQQAWNERRLKNLLADINNGYLPKELKAKFNGLLANNTPEQFKNINAQIAFFQQRAKQHKLRTPEQIAGIQRQWEQRLIRNLSNDALEINVYDEFYSQYISSLRTTMHANDVDAFTTQYKNAVRAMKNLRNKIIGAAIPYTPHVAMKTEYKTLEEVRKTLKTIGDGKSWFPTGRMRSLQSASIKANGLSNRIIGRIKLTPERSDLVRAAMGKIGKGKSWTITKEEADAMATLWHEMNHQMHIGNEVSGGRYSKSRSYMELANEFVSRKTLPDFYKSFGCKTTPYPSFIERRDSTGYDTMVCRYQYAINAGKLKLKDVVSSVRNGLINSPYNKQKTVLIDGLIAGGMQGKRTDIAKLVEMCESEKSEEAILKFMKGKGLIQSGSKA